MLYWNADLLSSFFKKVGDVNKAAYYADRAAEILEAVTKVNSPIYLIIIHIIKKKYLSTPFMNILYPTHYLFFLLF